MSCYHPLVACPKDYVNENGNIEYKIIGYLEQFARDENGSVDLDPEMIRIPCGRCIGCRLDQSRSWADRMMLELQHTGKAIFLTLTYDDEHVPYTTDDNGEFGALSLRKRDLQLFFKRLRKAMPDKEIRYYAVGEYGSKTLRPHYHAVIFGISKEDIYDNTLYKRNKLGDMLYMSVWLQEKVWQQGICSYSDVSWKTCAYVARYVQKKIFAGHDLLTDIYGVDKEFSVMSRRPGIGAYYLKEHPDLWKYSSIYVRSHDKAVTIPKYFLSSLKLTDPDLYASIKEQRQEFIDDKRLLQMQQTDLDEIEQLDVDEYKKISETKALRRDVL